MTAQLTLKRQHFTRVSRRDVERARKNPDALAKLLSSPNRRRTGLGIYWHAVPYLLTNKPTRLDEPYRWFVEGGETLGTNEAGDIRYLSPAQTKELASALENESPDDLGQLTFDEAEMDRQNVYPSHWVRWRDNDHLGTMRELYSYVRELVTSSTNTDGLLIHLDTETLEDEPVEFDVASPEPEDDGVPAPASPLGTLLYRGAERTYHASDASKHPKATAEALAAIDSEMRALGYSVVGDFTMSDDAGDTLRCFVSDDRTVIAIKYISSYAIGGYRFFSKLEDDALVVSSDAFIREFRKVNYFADLLQNHPAAALHDAVVKRRRKLQQHHGAPVSFDADVVTAAQIWDDQNTRLANAR
jgi:hypothetical protein